jgi:peptidoglycan hydrolase-like protein with peptidoglycan-binding domain
LSGKLRSASSDQRKNLRPWIKKDGKTERLPSLRRGSQKMFVDFHDGGSYGNERAIRKTHHFQPAQERAALGMRYIDMTRRFILLAVAVGFALVEAVWADDNVRDVQAKLRDGGFYSGEIDGAYSSQLSAALTRYQIRNGLPITGQLDVDTSKALGAKPAVATTAPDSAQSSETWRRLRKGEEKTLARTNVRDRSLPPADRSKPEVASRPSSPAATAPATIQSETQPVGSPLPENATAAQASAATSNSSSPLNISADRLRDYVGAFVLAGLDPRVGAEADFFADRVQYYDQGVMSREQIREDLKQYAARWPERRFWFAGDIRVEPQNGNRLRVTFPLRYDLRSGAQHSSGKIDKTLVLEVVGDDQQIVAVSERNTE